ncbi:MAG TPA: hypothetical protein PLD20_24610 [Blastocatellia bacterium]|nr:hypothetical protein [Blastocatellia bacterium]HMV84392.1 hypothetical protein [Blastocatellia bacterium]HMX30562.1 hypothetical protein [Blastocatellia bacterium]HMY75656.1 hypothetical protein [Blastocatellia bacterium]HMZ21139.1 hypothetical protein [Blastocatellia bacterium]
MTTDYYQLPLTQRRRMLADEGFARNDLRIWQHHDGRAIGEGVAAALTDFAFHRFLDAETPTHEKTRDSHITEAVHL